MSLIEDVKTDLTIGTPEDQHERAVQHFLKESLAKEEAKRRAQPTVRIELLDEAALNSRPAVNWLVQGLILESSLNFVVGQPGSMKTFVMLDLLLSIASGQSHWLGRRLTRQGPVVLVLAEGQLRFKYRMAVWKQERGITEPLPIYIVPQPVDLRNPTLMTTFLQKIEGLQPVLVVFDTLSRCIPGADENSAKELGEAIAAANLIQQATRAAVSLIHHPRKDGLSARGSGAVLGAVESELKMDKDKGLFVLSVGKQKEGDDDLKIHLKRKIVELAGVYEPTGELVTSCVLEVADPTDVTKSMAAASNLERRILEHVRINPNVLRGVLRKALGVRLTDLNDAVDRLIFDSKLSETTSGRSKKLNLRTAVLIP